MRDIWHETNEPKIISHEKHKMGKRKHKEQPRIANKWTYTRKEIDNYKHEGTGNIYDINQVIS